MTEVIQQYVWNAVMGLMWKVLGLVNWWLVAAVVVGAFIILAVLGKLMNKLMKVGLVAGALLLLVTLAPNRNAPPVVPTTTSSGDGLAGALAGEMVKETGKVIGKVGEAAAKLTAEALGEAGKVAQQVYEHLPSREQVADGLRRAGEQLVRAARQAIETMHLPDLPRLDQLPVIGPIARL